MYVTPLPQWNIPADEAKNKQTDVNLSQPIYLIANQDWSAWVATQSALIQQQITQQQANATAKGAQLFALHQDATTVFYAFRLDESPNLWSIAPLPYQLPEGKYHFLFAGEHLAQPTHAQLEEWLLGWGLGCYRFQYYKKAHASRCATANRCAVATIVATCQCAVRRDVSGTGFN